MCSPDEYPPFDVPYCDGLPMDWISNSRLPIWLVMISLFCSELTLISIAGGVPPYIYGDIGGVDRWVWFVLANLLALAAVCPFVGALSDLIGRRYVALIGASFIILGMIVCSTAHTMNIFICRYLWIFNTFT
jgi:MFS family permease